MKYNKKWFTFIEIIIAITIIGVWLIIIIQALTNSKVYLQKIRQKIIAINLAREGVEQVMNIRNTNRQKRAWEKEIARMKTNPSIDEISEWLENDPRFRSWTYIIKTAIISWEQYFYASWINQNFSINSGITWTNLVYSMCEKDWIRTPCPWEIPTSKEGYFFKRIKSYWIFKKESTNTGWDSIDCINWSFPWCWDETAKEFRFCSIVEYIWNGNGIVELCSVLTNYEK